MVLIIVSSSPLSRKDPCLERSGGGGKSGGGGWDGG